MLTEEDHEVFAEVGEILSDRNIDVAYLDYNKYHSFSEISKYDGVLAKKSREAAVDTIKKAENSGVSVYNGFQTHMRTNHNPASYWHLSNAGLNVPEWSTFREVGSKMVRKPKSETMREEPFRVKQIDGSRDHLYQEYVENRGIDHKLYGVRLQEEIALTSIETPSKLLNDSSRRRQITSEKEFNSIVESVMDIFDAEMIGVDVISSESEKYVVDVNATPSFRGTDMEPVIADSIQQFLQGKI